MPHRLASDAPDFETRFRALLSMKREDAPEVDADVAAIIADVRARGDAAVIELTAKFDRLELTPATLAFTAAEIDAACAAVPVEEARALDLAAERIRAYHARQMPWNEQWTDEAGATLGWRWSPVSAAGLYVPGGLASYPSSVLMNAIPAQVAARGGGSKPSGPVRRPCQRPAAKDRRSSLHAAMVRPPPAGCGTGARPRTRAGSRRDCRR